MPRAKTKAKTGGKPCPECAKAKAKASGRKSRSKTGLPECSSAMSAWVRARNAGQAVAEGVQAILGKCRSIARQRRMGEVHAQAGNVAKAQHIEHRLRQGVAGPVTQAERTAKAKQLLAQRAAKRAAAPAATRDSSSARSSTMSALRSKSAAFAARSKEHLAYKNDVTAEGAVKKPGESVRDANQRLQATRERFFGFKPIQGSEKQIAWATGIRSKIFPDAQEAAAMAAGVDKPGMSSEMLKQRADAREALRFVTSQTSARYWIDNRDKSLATLLTDRIKAVRANPSLAAPPSKRK